MQDQETREQLVSACHILAATGHNDFVWGHVAVRASDETGVWMKPSGLGMEEVGLDDLVLVGWDGTVLSGHRRRHAEYPIHTRVMAARPDVSATVHTHVASCTEFSSLDVPLRPISHEASYFAPHGVPGYTGTSDLILTDELGDDVAHTLGDAYAAFLVGHGMVTVGGDLVEAVMAALLLDNACTKQLAAVASGGPKRWTGEEEALAKRANVYPRALLEQGWDYLARTHASPVREGVRVGSRP
ncbi:MAG TPA: class II aldolase/adducin family protein [Nocardioidaceae bacterium]|nr:class II aldolase/adducin family protein [Nocardioidaceae bacterium]